jgi:flagellar motor switch protein FliN
MNPTEALTRYADLLLSVEAEIGRCAMPLRELVALAPGSVIKLPVRAGSPVQVLVGDAPFASGELMRADKGPAIRLLSFGGEGGK